jgi:lysine-N-methylase
MQPSHSLPVYRSPALPRTPTTLRDVPAQGVTAGRFLSAFQCLADQCEDICCRDWHITYDKASYERLGQVMGRTPSGAATFAERLVLGDGTQPGNAYAYVRPRSDGNCGFLGADSLCEVHSEHGEAMLSEACSIFPRASLQIRGARRVRVELTASLACPEVARLILLQEGSTDPVHAAPDLMPRPRIGTRIGEDGAEPWESAFDLVRDAAVRVISNRSVPLPWRLAAVAETAHRFGAHYRRDIASVDELRLRRDIARLDAPGNLDRVGAELERLSIPLESMLGVVLTILRERMRLAHSPRLSALVEKVSRSMLVEIGHADVPGPIPMDRLSAAYDRRRKLADSRIGSRVELIFRNYALHHWRRYPYTSSNSVLAHACKLQLRLSVLRFLFLGHPEIAALLASEHVEAQEAEAVVDNVAVEVVQIFVKGFEHAEAILRIVEESLDAAGDVALAHAVVLARSY